MLNRIFKCIGWFLSTICVFYTVDSIVYDHQWSGNVPNLLFAFYKAVGLFIGLAIYFFWFKRSNKTKIS